MTKLVYNISIATGIGMVGAGIAMVSVPGALVAVGSLVLALTMVGARMAGKG